MQDANRNRRTIRDSLAVFTAVLMLITGCSDDDTSATIDKDAGVDAGSDVAKDGGDAGVEVGDDSGMMDVGTENDGSSADSGTPAPLINLSDGPIQGAVAGSTLGYMNIPFAAPPTGELRWRPPQPVVPWEQVRDASEPGVICIQTSENPIQTTHTETSEDCLYLNVWTPDLTPAEPLPVMLWLHGGGNLNGGAVEHSSEGGMMSWDGQRFIEAASRPVVVVTANYRLGVLGFLAHPGLTQEGEASGNYGLMDQQAALRWVRDNISTFGGDPANVTLFGESAGAEDTCLHLVAPESAGLFHRAILESAPQAISGLFRWDLDRGEAQGAAFADLVDCSGADDTEVVACLRGLPVEELYKIDETDTLPGGLLYDILPLSSPLGFQAIIDGVVVPKLVADTIAANQHAKVPVIVGTNEAEGVLFHHPLLGALPATDEDEFMAALKRRFGDDADAVAAEYPVSDNDSYEDALIEVTGDSLFVCPDRNLARALTGQGGTVFEYNFTHTIEFVAYNALGPTHGMELIPLWTQSNYLTDSEKALGATMVDYWTRFAYTGDPNGDDAPPWPRFETETEPEIVLDVPISTVEGRKSDKCDFWASLEYWEP